MLVYQTTHRKRQAPVTDEIPSECLDRREAIVLAGESFAGREHRIFNVVRHSNGKFFNLTPADDMKEVKMEGRFSSLLFPIIAPPELREIARSTLDFLGHKIIEVSPK